MSSNPVKSVSFCSPKSIQWIFWILLKINECIKIPQYEKKSRIIKNNAILAPILQVDFINKCFSGNFVEPFLVVVGVEGTQWLLQVQFQQIKVMINTQRRYCAWQWTWGLLNVWFAKQPTNLIRGPVGNIWRKAHQKKGVDKRMKRRSKIKEEWRQLKWTLL